MTTEAIFGQEDRVLPWVGERIGYEFAKPAFTIGFLRGGDLVAGIVFNGYTGPNVDVSFAGHGELSVRAIRVGMTFAFRDLGVLRMTARTRRGNKALTRGLPKIGFRYEGVMRNYYGPHRKDDAVQFGLLAQDAARLMYHG